MTARYNNGGSIPVKEHSFTREQIMTAFDSMPYAMREVFRNSPYNLHIPYYVNSEWLQEKINRLKNESILATYGEDHPEYIK